jgi:hypothetical protein
MKYIEFPEGYALSKWYGVFAFPQGCWAVGLKDERPQNGVTRGSRVFAPAVCDTLLVWPDGEVGFIHGHFERSINHDRIVFLGELKNAEITALAYKDVRFGSHVDNPQAQMLKIGKKHVRAKQCRHKNIDKSLIKGYEPRKWAGTVAAPIPRDYPIFSDRDITDLDRVIMGIIGQNNGIGFYKPDSVATFINPNPNKDYKITCLSVDELTCLAVDERGGAIIDVPI